MTLEDVKKQFFAGDYCVQIESHDDYVGVRAEYFPELKVAQYGESFYDCDHGNCYSYGGDLVKAESIEIAWERVKDLFEDYIDNHNLVYFDFED